MINLTFVRRQLDICKEALQTRIINKWALTTRTSPEVRETIKSFGKLYGTIGCQRNCKAKLEGSFVGLYKFNCEGLKVQV